MYKSKLVNYLGTLKHFSTRDANYHNVIYTKIRHRHCVPQLGFPPRGFFIEIFQLFHNAYILLTWNQPLCKKIYLVVSEMKSFSIVITKELLNYNPHLHKVLFIAITYPIFYKRTCSISIIIQHVSCLDKHCVLLRNYLLSHTTFQTHFNLSSWISCTQGVHLLFEFAIFILCNIKQTKSINVSFTTPTFFTFTTVLHRLC